MKKVLLFVLMLLPMLASADAVEIDGIYYNFNSYDKTAEVTDNPNKYSGDVVIPASVTYEDEEYSVTTIGEWAFENCSGLTSVTIPNSVTSIGNYAFSSCSALTSITIGNSVTSIGGFAFSGCSALTSITIPNSMKSIGEWAFSVCSALTSITIPNSVISIGLAAFYDCSGLTSIVVEAGNPNYDSRNNCNALIETSSNTLIVGCKNTIIPNSVTSIGGDAFRNCSSLTSITIPNSVTSIGNYAFEGCSSLTSVNIPNSVTSIGSGAFEDCSSLTSVNLSNNLTKIERYTFSGCSSLTSITIPQNVTSIGTEAFRNCTSLTEVTSLNPIPPVKDTFYGIRDAFDGVDHTIPLYVPKGSVLKYKAADWWRNFVIIREITDEDNDVYLTISDGAHGSVKLKMDDANPIVTLKFEAESGWHVNSVTLNGDNVTAEVASDGTYTTPAIISNSLLSIVYAQGSTSAPSLELSNLYIHSAGNTLFIDGTKGNEQVSVLTLDGKCVVSQLATSGLTEILLDGHQTYIVKVGQETFKLLMK